ncbi:hypothetical protein U7230_01215 [Carboxydochorda subterranea]|uniref:Uncharacterized protein n=1 Tax=Carboxydichorda subterranea TaxID=3109565 RepID=A0ABZ1C026_9FIRM|nr:hypothetical protein [Limnochorda sp. L945t]WRP17668.1 hypothetical protein U7230_01215 [Limnochorda sp. L945t]
MRRPRRKPQAAPGRAAALFALVWAALAMVAPAGRAAASEAGAVATPARRPVLVLFWEGLHWPWLASHTAAQGEGSSFARWIGSSSMALLNPLVTNPRDALSAYATLASGVRQERLAGPILFARPDEASRATYRRRMGPPPALGPDGLLLLDAPQLARAMGQEASPPLGWLGDLMETAGYRRVVMGDGRWVGGPAEAVAFGRWLPWGEVRPLDLAALVAVDSRGTVPRAIRIDVQDPEAPGGVRTDWQAVWQELRALSVREGALGPPAVFVDSGDLLRLALEEQAMTPGAFRQAGEAVSARLGEFLERLRSDPYWAQATIIITALLPLPALPDPDGTERPALLLTPLLVRNLEGPGLLYSSSTRLDGFAIAPDLTATLARAFGLAHPPAPVAGRPLETAPGARLHAGQGPGSGSMVEWLRDWAVLRSRIYWLRPRVMPTLISLQVLVLLGALVAAWWPWRRVASLMADAAVWAAAVPVMLLLPVVVRPPPLLAGSGDSAWALAIAGSGALLLTWGARLAGKALGTGAVVIVAVLALASTIADAVAHLGLIGSSLMGYDLVAGARFYGVGNEHSGLMLSAALLVGLEAMRRTGRAWAGGLVIAATAVVTGWPGWGSDVGGGLAMTVAAVVATLAWARGGADLQQKGPDLLGRVLWGVAAGMALVLALGGWDALQPRPMQAHWGQALVASQEAGPGYLLEIARRKLALNVRLIRYSMYTRIMVVAMLVVTAAFLRAPRLSGRIAARDGAYVAMLQAAGAGALVALVANDSGVTAAATALLLPAASLLEESLDRRASEAVAAGGGD